MQVNLWGLVLHQKCTQCCSSQCPVVQCGKRSRRSKRSTMRPQIPPPKAAALTFCFPVLLEKRQIVSIFTCSSALTANILVVGRWISPDENCFPQQDMLWRLHSTGGQPHTNINTNTNKKRFKYRRAAWPTLTLDSSSSLPPFAPTLASSTLARSSGLALIFILMIIASKTVKIILMIVKIVLNHHVFGHHQHDCGIKNVSNPLYKR